MPDEWKPLVQDPHMAVAGSRIIVRLAREDVGRSRKHTVHVTTHLDGWELSGLAATAAQLKRTGTEPLELWSRNRRMRLAHYVVDEEGNAWVSAWLPDVSVTPDEFGFTVWHVAAEADRLEFLLTGEDEY